MTTTDATSGNSTENPAPKKKKARIPVGLDPISRLNRDLARAAATMTPWQARFLVNLYYTWQEQRIRTDHQARALDSAMPVEPHEVIDFFADQSRILEGQIKRALKPFAASSPAGQWMMSITGIAEVLSSGSLAHIDITKAPTVGHIWRYAGQDPTSTWGKGEKRPWNADLKVVCFKAGDCFVKNQNHSDDTYGQVYVARKAEEILRNERGDHEELAAKELTGRRWRDTTSPTYKAYASGKLPDGRIHLRAQRYALKLFLSHLHHVMYVYHFNELPPKPYVIDSPLHPTHTHFKEPPNFAPAEQRLWKDKARAEAEVGKVALAKFLAEQPGAPSPD